MNTEAGEALKAIQDECDALRAFLEDHPTVWHVSTIERNVAKLILALAHETDETKSVSNRLTPWEEEGVSRATWYRMQAQEPGAPDKIRDIASTPQTPNGRGSLS